MGDNTKIEWTDATWNPVTGCTKVSQGCKHCYAEREWPRLTKLVPAYAGRDFSDVRTHTDRLDQPLHWKRPRRIFVNSMSDLFHEDVPDHFIDQVFAVMALAPQHTFQILTKRARRLRDYMSEGGRAAAVFDIMRNSELGYLAGGDNFPPQSWPLPNVWLGVSVEDQAAADERIPLLLQTPAAVRWISAEPLLSPVDLSRWVFDREKTIRNCMNGPAACNWDQADSSMPYPLNWVVVGGESGPNARPMHPEWGRSLRDQCKAAGVPFLFKQWGEWAPRDSWIPASIKSQVAIKADGSQVDHDVIPQDVGGHRFEFVGKKAAGRLLDGVQHDGYPQVKVVA